MIKALILISIVISILKKIIFDICEMIIKIKKTNDELKK